MELHREPTMEELAEALDMTVESLARLKSYDVKVLSYDKPVNDDSDDSLIDFIKTDITDIEEDIEHRDRNQILLGVMLEKLTDRERIVLCMKNGIGYPRKYTLDEIGKRFGVTKQMARQIEKRAAKKLQMSPVIRNMAV
jgi:RNA polymerase primary sigma factor